MTLELVGLILAVGGIASYLGAGLGYYTALVRNEQHDTPPKGTP